MVGRALERREMSIAPLALADFVPTHQPLSPAGGSRLTVEHRRCRSCFLPTAPYQTCCTLGKRDDTSFTMNTAPGTAAASALGKSRAKRRLCAPSRNHRSQPASFPLATWRANSRSVCRELPRCIRKRWE
eukprot:scaffold87669_cov60-Phaeocystis_antarctica.AAC.2